MGNSIKSIIKRRTVKLITKFFDPLLATRIGNQTIEVPLSHSLRENILAHPELNYNLARIVKYITNKNDDVKVIDIGANIGDTVAYIKNYSDVPVLCIDGDEKYLNILKKNVSQYNNISICHSLVGAETKKISLELKSERGTAFLTESKTKNSIRTLQDILKDFPSFQNSTLLKIDTDGYDAVILKGCTNYLKSDAPILFFEFDPYLIKNNNDNPFTLLPYLATCGYRYFIFYMSNGDYLVSCDIETDRRIIDELVNFFSGRNIALYADVCAFTEKDKVIFDYSVTQEILHFQKARNF